MYYLAYHLSTKTTTVNRTDKLDQKHYYSYYYQSQVKGDSWEDKKQFLLKGFLRFLFLIFRHPPCFHDDEQNGK